MDDKKLTGRYLIAESAFQVYKVMTRWLDIESYVYHCEHIVQSNQDIFGASPGDLKMKVLAVWLQQYVDNHKGDDDGPD